jgi:hypothetical protein
VKSSVDVLEALFLTVMARIAYDAERNDGGPRAEFEIFAARKVDGAEILGGAVWICLGLALCLSRIACATAGSLDGRVRRRNGERLQVENGICCGWLGHVPGQLAVTYPGRSSVAFCTFSPRQTGGREYNDTE